MSRPKLGGWVVPGRPYVEEPKPTYEELGQIIVEKDQIINEQNAELDWYNSWVTDLLAGLKAHGGAAAQLAYKLTKQHDNAKRASNKAALSRTAQTDAFWKPWEDRYQVLAQTHETRDVAGIIAREMDIAEAHPPGKTDPPIPHTIRRRMKKAGIR